MRLSAKICFYWMPFALAGLLLSPFVPSLAYNTNAFLAGGTFLFGLLVMILTNDADPLNLLSFLGKTTHVLLTVFSIACVLHVDKSGNYGGLFDFTLRYRGPFELVVVPLGLIAAKNMFKFDLMDELSE